MSDELMPCPWCETKLALKVAGSGAAFSINCTGCGSVGPLAFSEASAAREWNCWTDGASLAQQLAAAREEATQLRMAVGLLSTLAPTVVMNPTDPLAMAKEIERDVTGQLAALRRQLAAIEAPTPEDVDAVAKAAFCDWDGLVRQEHRDSTWIRLHPHVVSAWSKVARAAIAAIWYRARQRISIAEPRGDAATVPAPSMTGVRECGATPLGSGDSSASPGTVALDAAAIAERVRGGQG